MSTIARKLKMGRAGVSSEQGPPPFTRLYTANNDFVYILDISDPSNISTITSTSATQAYGLAVDEEENVLYVGRNGRLDSFNISGDSFSLLQSYLDFFYADNVTAINLDKSRDLIFTFAADDNIIGTWDISNPSNMTPTGYIFSSTLYDKIDSPFYDTGNQIIYSVDNFNDGYFAITDVSNPYGSTGMVTLDSIFSTSNFLTANLDVDLNSNVAYVIGTSSMNTNLAITSFTSIDVSDPSNASILSILTGTEFSGFYPGDVAIDSAEQVAYVSLGFKFPSNFGTGGLVSIDISNPSSMSVIDSYFNSEPQVFLALDKGSNTLYSRSQYSIFTYDISNSSSISLISQFTGFSTIYPMILGYPQN